MSKGADFGLKDVVKLEYTTYVGPWLAAERVLEIVQLKTLPANRGCGANQLSPATKRYRQINLHK
jgi:hypothetical protein